MLGDFFVSSETTLGALAEIYSLPVEAEQTSMTLSDYFLEQMGRTPRQGDMVRLGDVVLQAHTISESRLVTVGIQLEDSETPEPKNLWAWIKSKLPRRGGES
jgi:cell volume regulation protein A